MASRGGRVINQQLSGKKEKTARPVGTPREHGRDRPLQSREKQGEARTGESTTGDVSDCEQAPLLLKTWF